MTIEEIFQKQTEAGATEKFFYGVETLADKIEDARIDIKCHRGTLDTFPNNLEFVRFMTPSNPLFRVKK